MKIDRASTSFLQKKSSKICAEENCSEVFIGVQSAKYCNKHNKYPYTILRWKKKKIITRSRNFVLTSKDHKQHSPYKDILECSTIGCTKKFSIMVYANITTYPLDCEEHRNKYKRERFEGLQDGRL